MLSVTISEGFRCKGGSVQSPAADPRDVRDAEPNSVVMDRDLCTENGNLANTHRKNVMFGVIRKMVTCLVRIKSVRGPRSSFERHYVPVKEIM